MDAPQKIKILSKVKYSFHRKDGGVINVPSSSIFELDKNLIDDVLFDWAVKEGSISILSEKTTEIPVEKEQKKKSK